MILLGKAFLIQCEPCADTIPDDNFASTVSKYSTSCIAFFL